MLFLFFPFCIPLTLSAASMVDVELGAHLMRALPPHAKLVLVGDQDQLPSVGPGSMFRDLLQVVDVPRVVLSQIFRQRVSTPGATGGPRTAPAIQTQAHLNFEAGNRGRYGSSFEAIDIWENAHAVNRGQMPRSFRSTLSVEGGLAASAVDGRSYDDGCVMLHAESPAQASQLVTGAVSALIGSGVPSHQIQVLSPVKRGAAGTVELNGMLQQMVNPKARVGSEEDRGAGAGEKERGYVFEGDRVIQLVNDYEQSVFNGDCGKSTSIAAAV